MSNGSAVTTPTSIEAGLRAAAATLKACRGPFLGDGIRPGINAYQLADLLLRAAESLSATTLERAAVTQEMVYAGIKECVAQGLVPRTVQGEDAYLRVHEQVAAVLAAAIKAEQRAT